ncbi:Zinc finger CCCH domain-containing protein 62 [Apostasia shenzhenica]|uniref:Zinc finger CCCH domain-containing protein 62 n=1 Tax=Apostasia shenzhenica TaxID=1088818 RepID=A0A2I0AFL1_9ASPA|nr:Zinc finger CCCH domain-containing protein 62 [Apostasia shenzhenica]
MRNRAAESTKLSDFLRCRPASDDDVESSKPPETEAAAIPAHCSDLSGESRAGSSPYNLSPWNPSAAPSPFIRSPWTYSAAAVAPVSDANGDYSTGLLCSMVREQGHVYSLATAGDLLYTGSDGKNIRVWKNRGEFGGFKSSSGLVKAIVVSGDGKVFTGHQDGKIRVWRASSKDPAVHKRVGTLPRFKDFLMSSVRPSGYVRVRRRRSAVWLRHFDAVSCLCLAAGGRLLYSGSWDRTLKVWRVSDSKCLESVNAHDDAVNAVAAGFDGLVFSGSADGTVKVWRREEATGRHVAEGTLLRHESAVTALAVAEKAGVVYSGSSDGVVDFWVKRRNMEHCGVLRGHGKAVLCLAAAGSLVISGSADKTICVWRREWVAAAPEMVHVLVTVLIGHEGPVKCLAVEEDSGDGGETPAGGRRWAVYSGSLDGSVKVWRVAEPSARLSLLLPPVEPTAATRGEFRRAWA